MAPVTKRRRTDAESEAAEIPPSDDDVQRNGSGEAGDEDGDSAVEDEQENRGQQKTESSSKRQRNGNGGVTSEQEKAQAISENYEHKSNVFRMETDELLSEVRLNYQKRMAAAEKALRHVKALIDAIPERLEVTIDDVEKESRKQNIHVPFPDPKPASDVKYKFSYVKPSYVNIVGSYALKTAIKDNENVSIDLALTMPSSIFQDKDYLNYRYFHKRAYYLATLAAALRKCKKLKAKVLYNYMNDDPLRPVIVLSPSGDGSELDFSAAKCTIRLIPGVSPNTFAISKLLPSKNCIRHSQPDSSDNATNGSGNVSNSPPTPSYNSSLLADTTYFVHLAMLHETSKSCATFQDACLLGRVWLRQRGFGGEISKGGFGNFEWALLMAFLLKGGGNRGHAVLSPGYSNYQMFKATIQFLASRDLVKNPLVFETNESLRHPENPVFFDDENGLNVLFKMTSWSYELLKHEAAVTLKMLNDSLFEHFDNTFLQRADEFYRFDTLARIPVPNKTELSTMVGSNLDGTSHVVLYARKLYKILKQGLTDRINLINLALPSTEPHGVSKPKESSKEKYITIGFLLNATQCGRAVDHGPSAEQKKDTAIYRKFWGPKAELRRFKDGSILESVVWTDKDAKQSIFQQIVHYVVGYHIAPKVSEAVTFIGDEFSRALSKSQTLETKSNVLFQPVMTGFDNLVKDLRALEGLPLQIRQISAAGAALRYSSLQTPLPATPGVSLMDPVDVMVQFESSGRWPDDLVAIQKTKIAFLLRMASLIEEAKEDNVHTRIGLENEGRQIMNSAFLDVIYMTGPVFRLRIYHDRESTLLDRRLKDKSLSPRSKEEAGLAYSEHQRSFIQGPLHTQEMQKLCHRFPYLSPSIRLVKKWFNSHLLSAHVSEELIELITARSFVHPSPWTEPSSVMSGFLRTIKFLSQWDWRTEPLIVDLSGGSITSTQIESIIAKFEAWRSNDPAMNRVVLFAASNHDFGGITWTEDGPSKVVACRMTALARSAYVATRQDCMALKVGSIFVSQLKDYDFVIRLNPRYTKSSLRKKKQEPVYKNLQPTGITEQDVAKVGLDPVHNFLLELSDIYSNNFVLFYDPESQNTVGCLWSPHTAPRSWKVNLSFSTVPLAKDEEEPKLVINRPAIIHEISRLGGELIANIEVNK